MKNSKLALAIAASLTTLMSAGYAQADIVTLSTRVGNNTSFGSAAGYLANWNTLPTSTPGYCTTTVGVWNGGNVNNNQLCGGPATDIAYAYHVDFQVGAAANYDFRIAPDFGFGGAVFLDGVAVAYNPNDMWWGGSFSDPSQYFSFGGLLSAGSHSLDVYGQEACCDGASAGQFQIDGQGFQPFQTASRVPEPLTIAMFGAGLAGMAARRRWQLKRA